MNPVIRTCLFWLLIVHMLFCGLFIFLPDILDRTFVSRIYKGFFLAGPFFRSDRITDTHFLSISWKIDGVWSDPVDPAKDSFYKYHRSLNPAHLYSNRLNRSLYQGLPFQTNLMLGADNRVELGKLVAWLRKNHVPPSADSLRLTFTRKRAQDFSMSKDSIQLTLVNESVDGI